MTPQPPKVDVFYSYSHKDVELRDQLETHLSTLKRDGIIESWHDRRIGAGAEWRGQLDEHLNSADIILLLVSSDFLASDYCIDVEVQRAMERHAAGEARVIPVILRPCDWQTAPFGTLQALPTGTKPITLWADRDEAFLNVAAGIRAAISDLLSSHDDDTLTDEAEAAALPGEIPRPPVVGFVARRDRDGRDIIERLREELAPGRDQLVVLWGAGGVGKTELAAESARKLSRDFKGRVVWVTADAREDLPFTTLLDEIARQLGDEDLRRLAPEQKAEAVSRLINSAPTLVVLDNFETISPAEEELCKDFLSRRARCSVLITSRQKIERFLSVPVEGMSPQEADVFLLRLIDQSPDRDIYTEAIRARIIHTAEANPLIIEWIVGQIDLANDPEEVLDELVHGQGAAANRVFDRSFNLPQLNNGGRAVLLALSLFVPSAERAALAFVANIDLGKKRDRERFKKAYETLASLWLIKKADAGQRLTVAGLTRELTRARLYRDPRVTTYRQRFVIRFLRHAKTNSKASAEHLNTLEVEKDNILSAMDVAFEIRDWRSAINIREAMQTFLDVRGYWDEAIRSGEQAMEAARAGGHKKWFAALAGNNASIRQDRGEYDAAKQAYLQANAAFAELGDEYNLAVGQYKLGTLVQIQGNMEEARQLYIESLTTFKKLNEGNDIAATLHQLGTISAAEADFVNAENFFNRSLEILRKLGHEPNTAHCLQSIGELKITQHFLIEAHQFLDEALELAETVKDKFRIASIKRSLALLAEKEGDKARAVKLLREALGVFEELKSPIAEKTRRDLERLSG